MRAGIHSVWLCFYVKSLVLQATRLGATYQLSHPERASSSPLSLPCPRSYSNTFILLLSSCPFLPRNDSALYAESISLLAEKVPVSVRGQCWPHSSWLLLKCCNLFELDLTLISQGRRWLRLSSMTEALSTAQGRSAYRHLTVCWKRERFLLPSAPKGLQRFGIVPVSCSDLAAPFPGAPGMEH